VSDARLFLETLERRMATRWSPSGQHASWLAWCRARVERYPAVVARQREPGAMINPYHFLDELIRRLDARHVIACGDGAACVVPFQVGHMKAGMRMFCNSGDASMGYDIPAAVGAAFGAPGREVVCLAGDGSAQLNIQELQTIVHHQLPIKLFILNNGGYLSIRMTQGGFFKGNFVGESARSGVSFPDYVAVARAYGMPATRIQGQAFGEPLDAFLAGTGPALCEVMLDPEQLFEPKLSSRQLPDGRIVSASLEDMAPFLEREELEENMLVPLPF
jgi:acetolactate synthase-1/2/3 large subunit